MKIRSIRAFAVSLIFLTLALPAFAQWSEPTVLWQEAWADPHALSMDDSATRLVTMIHTSGTDIASRDLMVTEKVGGIWQTPQVLASNGIYDGSSFVFLPSNTVPVMSGDGGTIAYLGASSSTYDIYISDWTGSNWGTPVMLTTGLFSHHYWLSLSADGNVLALCNYPFMSETQHVYVTRRDGGNWNPLVQVSSDTGDIGGCFPSLSADGTRLAWVANARLVFSSFYNGTWSAPVTLTSNNSFEYRVDYPQVSGDGESIYYWMLELEENGSGYTSIARELYIIRREGVGWGAPQKVNQTSVIPTLMDTDGPATADFHATRLVYTRPTFTTDGDGIRTINASDLDISEWQGGTTWSESQLVAEDGWVNYNRFPKLTPDGLHLAFDGGVRNTPYVPYALWEMTTGDDPPPAPSLIFKDGFESSNTSAWSSP